MAAKTAGMVKMSE